MDVFFCLSSVVALSVSGAKIIITAADTFLSSIDNSVRRYFRCFNTFFTCFRDFDKFDGNLQN